MRVKDINSVIERFEALPLEEKEYTIALMQKAYAEAARKALAQRAKQAARNAKSGKTKKGGAADLRKDLEG